MGPILLARFGSRTWRFRLWHPDLLLHPNPVALTSPLSSRAFMIREDIWIIRSIFLACNHQNQGLVMFTWLGKDRKRPPLHSYPMLQRNGSCGSVHPLWKRLIPRPPLNICGSMTTKSNGRQGNISELVSRSLLRTSSLSSTPIFPAYRHQLKKRSQRGKGRRLFNPHPTSEAGLQSTLHSPDRTPCFHDPTYSVFQPQTVQTTRTSPIP